MPAGRNRDTEHHVPADGAPVSGPVARSRDRADRGALVRAVACIDRAAESVAHVKQCLDDTAIPYLYISGNHDWHAEGLSGSSDALREEWRSKALLPLYGGRDPACWAENVGGVRFMVRKR